MDYPKFIESNQKEESIRIPRLKMKFVWRDVAYDVETVFCYVAAYIILKSVWNKSNA